MNICILKLDKRSEAVLPPATSTHMVAKPECFQGGSDKQNLPNNQDYSVLLRQLECTKGLAGVSIASMLNIVIIQWLLILPLPLRLARLEMPGLAQLTSC